jgi:hypothetical protein
MLIAAQRLVYCCHLELPVVVPETERIAQGDRCNDFVLHRGVDRDSSESAEK